MNYPPPYKTSKYTPPPTFIQRFSLHKLKPGNLFKSFKFYFKKTLFGRQHFSTLGNENPDKIFYVICNRIDKNDGLWAIVCRILEHIAYAHENGWIPVIEDKNINNNFTLTYGQFFKQPFAYSFNDIKKSKNIIFSSRDTHPLNEHFYISPEICLPENIERLNYYRNIFNKYVKFNEITEKFVDNDYKTIAQNHNKTPAWLGVLVRGTDYTLKRPSGHFVQPEIFSIINQSELTMKKQNCSSLYLATESQEVYDAFKSEFKSNLITNTDKRYNDKDIIGVKSLATYDRIHKNDRYSINLKYLSSTCILSKCKYFIGGLTMGTVGVYLMNRNFEYDYLYNLGIYK